MEFLATAITLGDGEGKAPRKELEQTSLLGESLIDQEKRRPKCATSSCKTPNFSPCCCALIKTLLNKRALADVGVVACCTVRTIHASHAAVRTKPVPTLNRDSVFAAASAASVRRRCRCAFSAAACIWRWRRACRRRWTSRANPATLALLVARAVPFDATLAGRLCALHAAGCVRSPSGQPARTLCRPARGVAAAAAGLSHPGNGGAPVHATGGMLITRRGCA
jgi:hypothetical protein